MIILMPASILEGWAHTNSESVQHCGLGKKITIVSCAPGGVRTRVTDVTEPRVRQPRVNSGSLRPTAGKVEPTVVFASKMKY